MVATVARDIESVLDDRDAESQRSVVSLQPVTWQTYQALLSDLGDHRSARLSYDRGTLEIKLPSKLHELVNRLLERIITTLTEELELNVVSLGSTRFDQESADQGVEPDSCFYIQNADRLDPMDASRPKIFRRIWWWKWTLPVRPDRGCRFIKRWAYRRSGVTSATA
jgi:Putative restriction endonuclease